MKILFCVNSSLHLYYSQLTMWVSCGTSYAILCGTSITHIYIYIYIYIHIFIYFALPIHHRTSNLIT